LKLTTCLGADTGPGRTGNVVNDFNQPVVTIAMAAIAHDGKAKIQ